ncbi:hypothetical protein B0A48_00978 [Cryoendolithus antarcticus]|uniref:Uncharacterized protein n=1 Tax=Cryoendolithus antarcticus TaxID=1507870 RepID=A0A1V8TSC2_9PEZI|nr:hypothetical protein B0A48_00978 [Cryoendolithus antarcticus]
MAVDFYFRIIGIEADTENIRIVDGGWRPPRAQGKNKYKLWPSGWQDHALFHHGNGITTRLQQASLAPPLDKYGTCSMYVANGSIWVVNCDATQKAIHDGEDNDTPDRGRTHHHEYSTRDWSHVQFNTVSTQIDPTRTMSCVTYDGEQEKLIYQHYDQEWAKKLFPDRYSRMGDRAVERGPRLGGLVGELPILLGLVALSVDPRGMQERIPNIVQGPPWVLPDGLGRTVGWDDRRGVLVEVWTKHDDSQSVDTLKRYEQGGFGKIFA